MSDATHSELSASLETLFAESPETLVFDNGLRVVFQQDPAHPLFSAQVWVCSGSIHEDKYLGSGLSHFLEHMLFKGTERRGPSAIAREVQAFGGQINAYTSFDRTVYYIDGPSESLTEALDILADMTLHSSLPADEVEKEKEVILREIDMTLDDPDRIVSRALFSTAFHEHPCRFPVIGLRPLFEKVDRGMLSEYYTSRYHPGNMVVAVAGDFERDQLLETIGNTFGIAERRCNTPVPVPAEPVQLALRETRLTGDYQTARGLTAYRIPSMRHKDSPALDIIGAILGAGHSGRLRQKLREEMGLVHGISASAWNPRDPGLFFTQFQCAPEKAAEAEAVIGDLLHDLGETGFTEEELQKARRFAFVSEVQSRATTSGLAARLGLITALVGDLNYPKRYFENILSLTTEDLRTLARRTFTPDKLSIATLLPDSLPGKATNGRKRATLPAFEESRLSNGARLLWQRDDRLPRTWLRFGGLGGPLYEESEYKGVTSLLSTLLVRDTRFRSAAEVASELEANGGFLTESSGNNSFALSVEVIPEKIDQGLDALRDAVLHPAFKTETLAREQEVQLAHLKEVQDEILDYGRLALREKFFGNHPFASGPLGNLETVAKIDQAVVNSHYKKLVVGPNSVLVAAGDFDPDILVPKLEAFLKDLPDTPFEQPEFPGSIPAQTGEFQETLNREQAVVLEAYPDVGFKPEADLVGEILDELLSDMSGPLFRSVREDQSLAYYVGAARLLGANYGSFFLYAGTHPTTSMAVYSCFEKELDRIRNGGVRMEELADARTRLKVQNRFSLQRPSARAARAALNVLFGKPVMDWLDFESRLDALKPEDLTRFARNQLSPDQRLRLRVGPKID
jgi:zinc protease